MSVNYSVWHRETVVQTLLNNLNNNLFEAIYLSNLQEVRDHVKNLIYPGMKVAFGGSMTVREIGLREIVAQSGAVIVDHNAQGLTDEEKMEAMRNQLLSDLFISSTNAITIDGHLINVDGNGNRVAAMIFGPKKVLVIAGLNKVVYSEEEGLSRIKHLAGPMNMKRLNRKTPCGADGICHDCSSPERGCRAYTIIRKRPSLTPTEVIIVGEALGM